MSAEQTFCITEQDLTCKTEGQRESLTVIVPNLGLPAEYRTFTSFIMLGDLSFKKTTFILVISLSMYSVPCSLPDEKENEGQLVRVQRVTG